MKIALPDGSERELADQASAADLAAQIGPGLAKSAVAAKVDGAVVDLSQPLHDGAQVAILTDRNDEALEILRHSAAHLMADAILRVFPAAQLTIGPVVENGFYYDLYLPNGQISSDDFPKIGDGRGIDGGKSVEIHQPIRPGDTLKATTTIAEIYDKTGRSGTMVFIVQRMSFVNQRGEPVATVDWRMIRST